MKRCCLLAPELAGHPSGGTRYNRALASALGGHLDVCEPDALDHHIAHAEARWLFIDSLYLDRAPEIARRARALGVRCGLLLHYLPSLVQGSAALTLAEREALDACDAIVVTGRYMQGELGRCGYALKPCALVEPGCEFQADTAARAAQRPTALIVAHVVPGKGIYDFLGSLAREMRPLDAFELDIAGSLAVDAVHAGACRELVEREPALRERVRFLGVLSDAELQRAYAAHDLCVSASRMEAYAMALAEARTVGVPIIALNGGNIAQHVDVRAGGELCGDIEALSSAFIRLARDPAELAARRAQARALTYPARPWRIAAQQFVRALERFDAELE